ncbi:hypothetical protein FDUTEX481_03189 [Tolypothrix sp. PCC 7601]|nr:hypothetical protein FDUTEX481_03189 [Tolypothrix sp. PCC 7601]
MKQRKRRDCLNSSNVRIDKGQRDAINRVCTKIAETRLIASVQKLILSH